HWSACDEFMFPIYEQVRDLGKIIHFHSGILYAFGDSSRFCRPALFEALINFPGLRFALAHISWPWTDECIALFGHFRSAAGHRGNESGMWIDTSRGTPDDWRLDALRKAVGFCGTNRLMYGTDTHPNTLGKSAPIHIGKDVDLLRGQIGVTEEQLQEFFWGAAEAFYAGT
ncbi:MAG: amidohydrolase family protein, partial [Bacteroidota bacterium]